MTPPETDLKLPSSVIAGCACGILMALILIRILIATSYGSTLFAKGILTVTACVLPWCADVFGERGLPLPLTEGIMTAVSCLSMLIYARNVSMDETTWVMMRGTVLLIHAASFVFFACRMKLRAGGKEDRL